MASGCLAPHDSLFFSMCACWESNRKSEGSKTLHSVISCAQQAPQRAAHTHTHSHALTVCEPNRDRQTCKPTCHWLMNWWTDNSVSACMCLQCAWGRVEIFSFIFSILHVFLCVCICYMSVRMACDHIVHVSVGLSSRGSTRSSLIPD